MAPESRILRKGAISFRLVHIPVSLHTATGEHAIDVDWLDARTMDPVGSKRINRKSGQEITKAHIVKGVAVEDRHHRKVEAGQTATVVQPAAGEPAGPKSADIVDLTELLNRSLKGGAAAQKNAPAMPAATRKRRHA